MANQLSSFDPVGAFQGARSRARGIQAQEQNLALQPRRNELADIQLQQARQGLKKGEQATGRESALRQSRFIISSNQALKGLPLEQRASAIQSLRPQAEQVGIDFSNIDLSQPLTDELLDQGSRDAAVLLQTLQAETGPRAFQKGATALVETEEGPAFATSILDPRTGETRTSIAPINAKLISKLGETGQEETLRKIEQATVIAENKGISKRNQEIITNGLAAADGTAVLKRGIDLLNTIDTGGFDRARLAAKQVFGIESADEGELSNLLGKAVLGQLRETFGAAFTAKEGESLQAIEANLGKSPAANRRLLQNALRIAERSAKRGIDRAIESGDLRTAADIQDSLDFILQPLEAPAPEGATDNGDGTFTLSDGRTVRRKGG